MTEVEHDKDSLEMAVKNLEGWQARSIVVEPALPVLASPSWRGIDGAPWRAYDRCSGESIFIKAMHPEAALYIDVPSAMDSAIKAGGMGIGPKVIKADLRAGLLFMEDLRDGWRVAGLEIFRSQEMTDKFLDARKRFQSVAPLSRTVSVFEEVERLFADLKAVGAKLSAEVEWMSDNVNLAAEAMRPGAAAPVPIHGDGNISNLMIDLDGDVRIVDWDRATNADPLEDVGSVMAEAYAFDPEARSAFTRYMGGFDQRAFDRARLYGVADDFRWGLIGLLLATCSPRKTHEFFKFAAWRFLRCRMAIRDPRFAERLRSV
ncbi:MAG: hypothetical protein JWP25_1250 [Bradyrhizobium sp.]|jgi:hypothetical protein|nr:hypothetical protein [Bradyrhizobium sp.]